MWEKILSFFTDPILAAPMWATMLMCLSASIVGVLMVVRRRALLGEAISHTTYLGIALMIYFGADLFTASPWLFPIFVMMGAFISAMVGLMLILMMEKNFKVSPDSALCFVLSTFLGLGVLLASRLQFTQPLWSQKVQMFLYGQAATITSSNVIIYAILTVVLLLTLFSFYPSIVVLSFDREYATTSKMNTLVVGVLIRTLLIASIVIGIRSVGVLMMAGMLIAPAAAAKMVVKRFSHVLIAAGIFGVLSGMLGNIASNVLSETLRESLTDFRVTFPTGPMILITAVLFSVVIMLFAKKKGFIWRTLRRNRFRVVCTAENILKRMLKEERPMRFSELTESLGISIRRSIRPLFRLYLRGHLSYEGGRFALSEAGALRAKKIVRLHRLWELYLFNELGVNASEVHHSAEEMEHILTPDIERELTFRLGNPKKDPHDQIIPLIEEEV